MRRWLKKDYWSERLPFYKAVLWISFVTFTISGSAFFGFVYYKHVQELRSSDSKYAIRAVVQNCCGGMILPTSYLTEILNLSADVPFHLYKWNIAEAEKQIQTSPYIKSATIERIAPDTLKINYYSRIPVAIIGDLTNGAIDSEGYLLPRHTQFLESSLPKFVIGVERVQWGEKITTPEVALALELRKMIDKEFPQQKLISVDVSRAFARSAGKRQAVIVFEKEGVNHILRVTANNFPQQLANYKQLVASNKLTTTASTTIDLRLNHLAYLTQGEPNDGVYRDSMDIGKH
jgi:hypothetical protein